MLFVVWTCKIMDCSWADLESDLGLILASYKDTNVPIIWDKIDIATLSV